MQVNILVWAQILGLPNSLHAESNMDGQVPMLAGVFKMDRHAHMFAETFMRLGRKVFFFFSIIGKVFKKYKILSSSLKKNYIINWIFQNVKVSL